MGMTIGENSFASMLAATPMKYRGGKEKVDIYIKNGLK